MESRQDLEVQFNDLLKSLKSGDEQHTKVLLDRIQKIIWYINDRI